MNKIVSLILAAGSSTRMGQPKQLLKWGDYTLLDHAIETVLEANTHEVILVLGSNFELINKTIKNHGVTILYNKNWTQGLGTSIACGAHYISNSIPNIDGVLLVLADQPLIDSHYLKSMIKNFVPNNKQIMATLYNNGKQGVPVLFDKHYIEELLNNFNWDTNFKSFENSSIQKLLFNNTQLSGSQSSSYFDYSKSILNRITNNLPYIYKTKGTKNSFELVRNISEYHHK